MLRSTVLPLLPAPLQEELLQRLRASDLHAKQICEVRLRQGRVSSLSLFRGGNLINLPLSHRATEKELRECVARAAGGSVYAHEETIKEGYLTVSGGIRVGICGKAAVRGGEVLSLGSVDSLVFRIPHTVAHIADALCRFFEQSQGGILLFAPPGGGKTTVLRDFIHTMGQKKRIAVVDTRGEFFLSQDTLLVDLLIGYPKAKGAEIAVRTLSPEILVLDEIGAKEASALASLVSLGVRTVASVHASDASALLHATATRSLLATGLFSHLWDIGADSPLSCERSEAIS